MRAAGRHGEAVRKPAETPHTGAEKKGDMGVQKSGCNEVGQSQGEIWTGSKHTFRLWLPFMSAADSKESSVMYDSIAPLSYISRASTSRTREPIPSPLLPPAPLTVLE